jgi:hypothetical protein
MTSGANELFGIFEIAAAAPRRFDLDQFADAWPLLEIESDRSRLDSASEC